MTFGQGPKFCDDPVAHGCGRQQAPGYPKPTVDIPLPQWYVNVRGPGAKMDSPFGIASFQIESPDDVKVDPCGMLVITTAAGWRTNPRTRERRRYESAKVVYRETAWNRYDIKQMIR